MGRRRRAVRGILVVGVLVAVVTAAVWGLSALLSSKPAPVPVVSSTPAVPATTTAEVSASAVAAMVIEVPSLIGKRKADAEMILSYAGLTSVSAPRTAVSAESTVTSQHPKAGARVRKGTEIRLSYALAPVRPRSVQRHIVVCIDPGHQARSDIGQEPVGPGSKVTKDKATGGATGVVTHVAEYQVVLQICMLLKADLEQHGVQVVMTRLTDDVNLSNARRAEMANKAGADLFVRVHAESDPDPRTAGVRTLYPEANAWTKPIADRSRRAAVAIEDSTASATGAQRLGVDARGDVTGFNWSRVPVVLVETGFLSNRVEDRLLTSPAYQAKLARGISSGVLRYVGR